eukprot:jgi/Bigna1/36419/e_gw1.14.23.1
MQKRDIERIENPEGTLDAVIYDCDELYALSLKQKDRAANIPPQPYYKVKGQTDTTPVFESRFEGGNLRRVVQVYQWEFDLIIRPDINTNGHTQWFYFSISNTRAAQYKLNLINFQKPDSMYNYGMRPLIFSRVAARERGAGWLRTGENICYYQNHLKRAKQNNKPYFTLTFTVELKHENDTVYFAYCYPYSYTDLRYDLALMQRQPAVSRLMRRRALCQTLGGNECDLLTISNFNSTSEEIRDRKGIVVTARVHPGETNASWMMRGFLAFITGQSAAARYLRNNIVFKVVPMLNPDGVINGNYRCSLAGVDLNRKYDVPCAVRNPTVFEVKMMAKKLLANREIPLCIDLHGHSRKPNIFMYGCENGRPEDPYYHHERVFPYMLFDNGNNFFSYRDCNFKVSKKKESCARVVYRKEMGIINSYTMEASFAGTDFGKQKGGSSIH